MGLDMATGKKMSDYTPLSELSSEEKATYLSNAAVTTFGAKVSEGDKINVNIPLSTLVPSATDLAGDGLSVNGSTGKLDVSNKVPAPTATTDRGKVLTVDNTDAVVWATPAAPSVTVDGTTIQNGVDGLHVNLGPSLVVGSGALCVKLQEKKGLASEDQGLKVVPDAGIVITSTGGVGLDFDNANNGDVLSCLKTVDPDSGDVTYDVNWVAPGGGGGGLSPISPTVLTPTLNGTTYTITIPSNNAYYSATISNSGDVDIVPPSLGSNELYNVVLFITITDFDDRYIKVPNYDTFGLAPMDAETDAGKINGRGFTQFVFLGHGYTMKTSAYAGG